MILSDSNGNTANIFFYGSQVLAQAALDSLKDCRNCVNCSDCSGCSDCSRCLDCSHCSRCSGCSHCSDCSGCSDCSRCLGCSHCSRCLGCSRCSDCSQIRDAVSPLVVGPLRSDGYQFVMGVSGSIHAGCRVFPSLTEAFRHWTNTRGGTPLGEETMLILNMLKILADLKESQKE